VKLITDGYETRDLGDITYALGVKVERSKNGDIRLSQKSYIESTLSKYGLTECRTAAAPLDHGTKMSKRDGPSSPDEKAEMAAVPYRRLVGSLMHLAIYTRPDIIHAVTKLSQFNKSRPDTLESSKAPPTLSKWDERVNFTIHSRSNT